ncbi:DapH/DapD/GlmU-related protein [Paludisphaera rhizosphaerae]|uniref:DapH/DapD/GlmU-related protein n=1 Tax=Paludisphaera rhizosphaerae TaxID=2711216 RepID=UPI0013EC21EC|nr:DapH/DapD/GlmU-related protein [Paludisphaera rhizosphaerae]
MVNAGVSHPEIANGVHQTEATAARPPIRLSKLPKNLSPRTKPVWFEAVWMLTEALLVSNPLQISSGLRVAVLRLFGAKIGVETLIRDVRVKYPWKLEVGDRCWIGERVWFHNQDHLTIGCDSVVSQETFITTGSHDIAETMHLVTKPVRIGDGVWITSRCIVQMGVTIGDNAIVTPGSVVHRSLASGGIYGGNPATFKRNRWVENPERDLVSQMGNPEAAPL